MWNDRFKRKCQRARSHFTYLIAGQSVFNGASTYPPSSSMRVVFFVTTILSSVKEVASLLITTVDPSLYMVISENSIGEPVGLPSPVGLGVVGFVAIGLLVLTDATGLGEGLNVGLNVGLCHTCG